MRDMILPEEAEVVEALLQQAERAEDAKRNSAINLLDDEVVTAAAAAAATEDTSTEDTATATPPPTLRELVFAFITFIVDTERYDLSSNLSNDAAAASYLKHIAARDDDHDLGGVQSNKLYQSFRMRRGEVARCGCHEGVTNPGTRTVSGHELSCPLLTARRVFIAIRRMRRGLPADDLVSESSNNSNKRWMKTPWGERCVAAYLDAGGDPSFLASAYAMMNFYLQSSTISSLQVFAGNERKRLQREAAEQKAEEEKLCVCGFDSKDTLSRAERQQRWDSFFLDEFYRTSTGNTCKHARLCPQGLMLAIEDADEYYDEKLEIDSVITADEIRQITNRICHRMVTVRDDAEQTLRNKTVAQELINAQAAADRAWHADDDDDRPRPVIDAVAVTQVAEAKARRAWCTSRWQLGNDDDAEQQAEDDFTAAEATKVAEKFTEYVELFFIERGKWLAEESKKEGGNNNNNTRGAGIVAVTDEKAARESITTRVKSCVATFYGSNKAPACEKEFLGDPRPSSDSTSVLRCRCGVSGSGNKVHAPWCPRLTFTDLAIELHVHRWRNEKIRAVGAAGAGASGVAVGAAAAAVGK